MKKIAVIGIGRTYEHYSEVIKKYYKIVCISDSYYSDKITTYDGMLYVPILKLKEVECDAYLICCTQPKYYWQIWFELVSEIDIDKSKIMDCLSLQELDLFIEREKLSDRLSKYERDMEQYQLEENSRFKIEKEHIFPLLFEYDKNASQVSMFYFHFEHWCAKHIYNLRPENHYDIGGRIEGFINRLLTFGQHVTMIDIRPMDLHIDGLKFVQDNGVELGGIQDNSIESLSCLGVIESYGLGRWGDPVDPNAWYKGLKSIQRVLRNDGAAYIAVPIGKERLEFNGRYVFQPKTIVDSMNEMKLVEFCVADPEKDNIINSGLHDYDDYAGETQIMGCFLFKKESRSTQ